MKRSTWAKLIANKLKGWSRPLESVVLVWGMDLILSASANANSRKQNSPSEQAKESYENRRLDPDSFDFLAGELRSQVKKRMLLCNASGNLKRNPSGLSGAGKQQLQRSMLLSMNPSGK
mmetsp:Transcript_42750/g.70886  ORF Transcript_42750/g.70886 Transcript_42750/m.70886 type:complete len:119 (+) Transcript_42750:141-497(+)